MIDSEYSLRILALCECAMIGSTAQFWSKYSDREAVDRAVHEPAVAAKFDELRARAESGERMLCIFDEGFPPFNVAFRASERPFLFFYRGDISLLLQVGRNIAVIGGTDPTPEIAVREREIVRTLAESGITVVSGLARGCDEIAHASCLERGAKTVAFLPSTLEKIYPTANRRLAERIVENGGLIVTEYYREAMSRGETVGRFIGRDRLQALFSKTVILIASHTKGQGDSGSRFAMEYAEKMHLPRYVMYNGKTDETNRLMGLNRELLVCGAEALTGTTLAEAIAAPPPKTVAGKPWQIKLF